jgi:hypothetical protein
MRGWAAGKLEEKRRGMLVMNIKYVDIGRREAA